jgi:hypothetical protein
VSLSADQPRPRELAGVRRILPGRSHSVRPGAQRQLRSSRLRRPTGDCRCAPLAARHRRDPATPGRRPHRTARGRNGLMAPRKAQDASSPAAPSIRRSPCPGTRLGRRTSGP